MKTVHLYILAMATSGALSTNAGIIEGKVTDINDNEPIPSASVKVLPGYLAILTDSEGRFRLSVPDGSHTLIASYTGYSPDTVRINLHDRCNLKFKLHQNTHTLGEVVVTAREAEGLSSGSRIDRAAMQHLQPSSFSDLLELLPGSISKDPSLTAANSITLRETGNLGATGQPVNNDDYAMSSLGTGFIVDGAPIGTDSDLQSVGTISDATSPHYTRNHLNKGVDMRSISTDNIESVEIIRGIPGAEYGNLTAGMVNIKRINRRTPLTARFKADGYSKLFHIGKGFSLGSRHHILNLDLGYLDAKEDPRDARETYRRLTASARFSAVWPISDGNLEWKFSVDYTGSFDNVKKDPELSLLKIDTYKSSYNRTSFTTLLNWTSGLEWLESVRFNGSGSLRNDILEQRRQVAPTHPSVAPVSCTEGVHDGKFILNEYIADYRSEGRPVDFFGKLTAEGSLKLFSGFTASYKAGFEYSISKNYGKRQIYDPAQPLSASWTSRPRPYSEIPALHQWTSFFQEQTAIEAGKSGRLDIQAGVRFQAMTRLDNRYEISRKIYADPRLNVIWYIGTHDRVRPFFGGGWGNTTRMPTADYLYPQPHYTDLVQLSYYDAAHPMEYSRINLRTYIDNTVNYGIQPARNRKWELRGGLSLGNNSLSITWFNESLSSGFRYSTVYKAYEYTLYDASVINPSLLTGPPSIDGLPSETISILSGYRTPSNGTRILKKGLEYQLRTARWQTLRTALTISGAWFRSIYSNSQLLFIPVSHVVDNVNISDKVVGLYDSSEGRRNEQFNTNFMFDTQIPRYGFIFTTTLQCMWYVKTRQLKKNGMPTAYISAGDGALHEYVPDMAEDPILGKLIRTYNENLFAEVRIPPALYINLKATKNIGKWLDISLFVNRIIDYLPDYTVNGLTVRRNSDAYFGMELNIKI